MNLNKIIKPILTIILIAFSFYYTNKSIELVRNLDPLMKVIKEKESKYEKKAENAKVIGNKIIPGVVGKEVDYEKSYTKMKRYGAYNEALTTFKEVEPTISINDHYDKYVVSGNNEYKQVALVFKVEKDTDPIPITNILLKENVKATLFVDGLFIENNSNYIKSLNTFEIELLSYDSKYDEIYFNSSINYLESLTNKSTKYCYTDYDQKEILELCKKLKLHTIMPTIKVDKSPYQEIKEKLSNASIISLRTTQTTKEQLSSVINYIKSKGYNFALLEELLNENQEK